MPLDQGFVGGEDGEMTRDQVVMAAREGPNQACSACEWMRRVSACTCACVLRRFLGVRERRCACMKAHACWRVHAGARCAMPAHQERATTGPNHKR